MKQSGFELVESVPPKGVKELTCGKCVAAGVLGRMVPIPEPDLINPNMDLKAFRAEIGMKGTQLAKYLNVHKAMVSQVENMKKEMPIAWLEKLKKLTDPSIVSRWTK
jgi:hypothetical protein